MQFIGVSTGPRRIVGIAADVDDENIVPDRAMTVYHPLEQEIGGGGLFVHARTDPSALVTPVIRTIREMAPDQPVERAATREDVRPEVLAPDRLNVLVFGGFAGVAPLIAVVGAAGVLGGYVLARIAAGWVEQARMPGMAPLAGVAVILLLAAVVASLLPAARASTVDVVQALRAD